MTAGPDGSAGTIALVNGRVALPERIDPGLAVVCQGGRIASLVPGSHVSTSAVRVDVGGRLISPGLIDVHAHGALGHEFADGDEHGTSAILDHYASCGITAVLPTLSTAPLDRTVSALRALAGRRAEPGECQVIGAHLEGPYLSEAQRGAHDAADLRLPDDGNAEQLLEFGTAIRMITVAPELPGAIRLIEEITAAGIVAAVGHSNGREDDLHAAVGAGARHVIHLWSGQSTTVREGPWRRPGMLEATLASDGVTAEIIADDRHLPRTLMRLAYRCLGERLCAVSDATRGAGMPEGTQYGTARNRRVVRDGVGMLTDGTSFAGSTTLLNAMVPILRDVVGIPLAEALRMVTATPAAIAGVADRKGRIEVGMDADLAVFEDDFSIWRTMVGGRWR